MSKEALIIAILVALLILWITETLGMKKTSKLLSGAIDLGFAVLRQLNTNKGSDKMSEPFILYIIIYRQILLYISAIYCNCADVWGKGVFVVKSV